MRVLARNPLYLSRAKYANFQPEFVEYEGEPAAVPDWVEPGTLCLTTGDARWPLRIIHGDMVVSIDNNAAPVIVPVLKDRVVKVKGSKGDIYLVTIGPNGRSCTCSGFGFRRSCKHIAEAV